jgi:hypothetical protein
MTGFVLFGERRGKKGCHSERSEESKITIAFNMERKKEPLYKFIKRNDKKVYYFASYLYIPSPRCKMVYCIK